MLIRLRDTGRVLTDISYRIENRHRVVPGGELLNEEWLNANGADVCFEGPQAVPTDVYGFSYLAGTEQIEGKWYTKYAVGPVFTDTTAEDGTVTTAAQHEAAYKATKDAEQAKSVREQRNQKLKDSDWTQLIDAPVDRQAWVVYRQELRDITSQAGFPWNIQWPAQPE